MHGGQAGEWLRGTKADGSLAGTPLDDGDDGGGGWLSQLPQRPPGAHQLNVGVHSPPRIWLESNSSPRRSRIVARGATGFAPLAALRAAAGRARAGALGQREAAIMFQVGLEEMKGGSERLRGAASPTAPRTDACEGSSVYEVSGSVWGVLSPLTCALRVVQITESLAQGLNWGVRGLEGTVTDDQRQERGATPSRGALHTLPPPGRRRRRRVPPLRALPSVLRQLLHWSSSFWAWDRLMYGPGTCTAACLVAKAAAARGSAPSGAQRPGGLLPSLPYLLLPVASVSTPVKG